MSRTARQMAARAFSVVCVLIAAACTAAEKKPDISVQNFLSKCVAIRSVNVTSGRNFPELVLEIEHAASTANCGCRSMLNRLETKALFDGFKSTLLVGDFTFPESTHLVLPLALQNDAVKNAHGFKVTISCSPSP